MKMVLKITCILATLCMVSCKSKCDACQNPVCPDVAPQVQNCPAPEKLSWAQVSEEDRAKLRESLISEIKSEMREAWIEEFEAEQARIAEEKAIEAAKKIPTVKPAKLPPTQKIERDPGGMKILRQVFTTQVVRRLPQDDREAFSVSDATVNCFVEIMSASEEERMITIRFTHSTGLTQSYTLPVGQSPAWRTWSKLNLTRAMTGTWLCEVFNEEGTLLASRAFVVVE